MRDAVARRDDEEQRHLPGRPSDTLELLEWKPSRRDLVFIVAGFCNSADESDNPPVRSPSAEGHVPSPVCNCRGSAASATAKPHWMLCDKQAPVTSRAHLWHEVHNRAGGSVVTQRPRQEAVKEQDPQAAPDPLHEDTVDL